MYSTKMLVQDVFALTMGACSAFPCVQKLGQQSAQKEKKLSSTQKCPNLNVNVQQERVSQKVKYIFFICRYN